MATDAVVTITRERWLTDRIEHLRPIFTAVGTTLPAPGEVVVSCGWPSVRGTSRNRRVIGECWKREASSGKRNEIFISPTIANGAEALAVLVHELIHAAYPDAKHGSAFRKVMKAVGLEGLPTATKAGAALLQTLNEIAGGEAYPHYELIPLTKIKKQASRMHKCLCPACGYTCRLAKAWAAIGRLKCPNPTCEVFDKEMDVPDLISETPEGEVPGPGEDDGEGEGE